jgi:hypothetical protein
VSCPLPTMVRVRLRNHAISLKRMSLESATAFDRRGTRRLDPREGGEEPIEEGGAILFEVAPTAVLVLHTTVKSREKKLVWIGRGNGGRAGRGIKEAVDLPFRERR